MLGVFLLLCAVIAAIFGLVRLFTPQYAKVTPRTLSNSLLRATEGGSKPGGGLEHCRKLGSDWTCAVPARSGSPATPARYKVHLTDRYCWTAVKTIKESDGDPLPREAADCVTTEDKPG
jgi:hypothetical protein